MRIARILTPTGPQHAVADGDSWAFINDVFATPHVRTGEAVPMEGTALLAPVEPRDILGLGHNLTNNDHPPPHAGVA